MNELDNIFRVDSVQHIFLPSEILLNLLLSFCLGMFVSYTYKLTHKGLSYSQSFMLTNVFVAVIVCMVIMVIGNNLARAFALVGALSIIRFRTVVKDTKDTAYIFWSLAAGLAAGTGSYFLAISGSVLIGLIAYVLNYTDYGSISKSEFILQFRISKTEDYENYINIIKEHSKSSTLLHSEPSADAKTIKVSYDITLKEESEQDILVSELAKEKTLSEIVLIAASNNVDF